MSRREILSGWGRTAARTCTVYEGTAAELPARLQAAGTRGVCMRGSGRGYGDCAVNGGGEVYHLGGGDIRIDPTTGLAVVGGGCALRELRRIAAEHGLAVPVVPGTEEVTVGGMIAADIHGKNHHQAGSIGAWVRRIALLDGDGVMREVRPGSDEFAATVGGMGLTGAICEAEIELQRVPGHSILQTGSRHRRLSDVIAAMREADAATFSVAWLDLAERHARGTVLRGEWCATHTHKGRERGAVHVPQTGVNFVQRASVRAFNAAWWQRARLDERERVVPMRAFFHPLDGVGSWNRLYGANGFIQYQFVVPEHSLATLERIVEDLVRRGVATPMVVLKRFGTASGSMLSFPIEGWTLAVDIAADVDGLAHILWRYDDWVAEAGGRVYLAKDACLRETHVAAMYPELPAWRAVRATLDPRRVYQSDLARRLGL